MNNKIMLVTATAGLLLIACTGARAGTPIGCGCINPNEIVIGGYSPVDVCDIEAVSRGYSGGRTRAARAGDEAYGGFAPFDGCTQYIDLKPVCITAGSVSQKSTTEATICEGKGNI